MLLVAGLSLFGLWTLEKGKVALNRNRTQKGRETRLSNLEAEKKFNQEKEVNQEEEDILNENGHGSYFPDLKEENKTEHGKTES